MTSAVLYELEPGVTYSFKVRSVNTGGVSPFSNVASATTELTPPAAPTGLSAAAVASFRIDLTWSDNSSNEDSFEVAESRNGKSFKVVATLRPQTTSFSRFGLRAGTTYHYRVRACNPAGCSLYSNTATATTPR
jgi:titin